MGNLAGIYLLTKAMDRHRTTYKRINKASRFKLLFQISLKPTFAPKKEETNQFSFDFSSKTPSSLLTKLIHLFSAA
jgi:hypothetical protein